MYVNKIHRATYFFIYNVYGIIQFKQNFQRNIEPRSTNKFSALEFNFVSVYIKLPLAVSKCKLLL